jgi:hypothetical protein
MRKILLGLTTALAFGVLAVPSVAPAASVTAHSSGVTAHSSGGTSINSRAGMNTSVQGTRNFAVTHNTGVRNAAVTNNVQGWNGQQRWAWNGRHHRRHHRDRDFLFVPFAAYGDYAAYDYCWQTVWTPAGFKRIYVCGSDDYYVY